MVRRDHNFGTDVGFTEKDRNYLVTRGVPTGDVDELMEIADDLSQIVARKGEFPGGNTRIDPALARISRRQLLVLYQVSEGDLETAAAIVDIAQTVKADMHHLGMGTPQRALSLALTAYTTKGPRALRID